MEEAPTAVDVDPEAGPCGPRGEFDAEEALRELQSTCRKHGIKEPRTCVGGLRLAREMVYMAGAESSFLSNMERTAEAHGALLQTLMASLEKLRNGLGESCERMARYLQDPEGFVLDASQHQSRKGQRIEGTDTGSGDEGKSQIEGFRARKRARLERRLRGFGYGGIGSSKYRHND